MIEVNGKRLKLAGSIDQTDCKWCCPHCNQQVAYRTYEKHKRLYYDSFKKSWTKVKIPNSSGTGEIKYSIYKMFQAIVTKLNIFLQLL